MTGREKRHGAAPGRRRVLARVTRAALGAAVLPLLVAPGPAAAAKMLKTAAKYRPEPEGAARCEACRHFVPEGDTGSGTCRLVEGAIHRDGWCELFTAKKA